MILSMSPGVRISFGHDGSVVICVIWFQLSVVDYHRSFKFCILAIVILFFINSTVKSKDWVKMRISNDHAKVSFFG